MVWAQARKLLWCQAPSIGWFALLERTPKATALNLWKLHRNMQSLASFFLLAVWHYVSVVLHITPDKTYILTCSPWH